MNKNENKTFADVVVELRKKQNLTQQQLANKLNITDKAVSKWERGLSYPDITSISKLASILGVDSSYLIDLCKSEENPYSNDNKTEEMKNIIHLILKGIGLAMGISVTVLNIINQIPVKDSIVLLSIGLACLSLSSMIQDKENEKNELRKNSKL